MKEVIVDSVKIGAGNPLVLIAGPCVIENETSALEHARLIKKVAGKAGIPLIYKSSYDKANRTSIDSFRGPGLKKGLKILKRVKEELKIPVLSDIHTQGEIKEAEKVLDVIQIPALLCRQTDLLLAAGRTGKPINIKKGQFLSPEDMEPIIKKIASTGNENILLTERGSCFGYRNLISDFRSLVIMGKFSYPVIYDATHVGCDGIFIEVHQHPEEALCDGPNSLPLAELLELIQTIKEIDRITHGYKKS